MGPHLLVTLLVLAPLLGAAVAGLAGRRIGDVPSMAVTTGLLIASCLLAWLTFAQVIGGRWPAGRSAPRAAGVAVDRPRARGAALVVSRRPTWRSAGGSPSRTAVR